MHTSLDHTNTSTRTHAHTHKHTCARTHARTQATTNPDQKFDLGEEKEKPAFGADALGKKKDGGTATESAAEAPVEAAAEE